MPTFESKVKALMHHEMLGVSDGGHGVVNERYDITIPDRNISDLIDLAREADTALSAAEFRAITAESAAQGMETELINLRNGYYRDEEIARLTKIEEAFETMTGINLDLVHKNERLTALNTARGELIALYASQTFPDKYLQEDIDELVARIRSLENEVV